MRSRRRRESPRSTSSGKPGFVERLRVPYAASGVLSDAIRVHSGPRGRNFDGQVFGRVARGREGLRLANCGGRIWGIWHSVQIVARPSTGVSARNAGRRCPRARNPRRVRRRLPILLSPPRRGMTDNVASALCYALGFITGILFLVLAPYNQNRMVRFHAFQSIFSKRRDDRLFVRVEHSPRDIPFSRRHLRPLSRAADLARIFHPVALSDVRRLSESKKVVLPIIGPLAEQQA